MIPFVGGIRATIEAVTGKDMLTGRPLSNEERLLNLGFAALAGLGVGAKLLSKAAKATRATSVGVMWSAGKAVNAKGEASTGGNVARDGRRVANQTDEGAGLEARRINSFVAGTPVATEQGLRPIEELKIGDKVWAKDPMTGEQGYHAITWLTNHTTDEVVQITVLADQSSNNLNVAAGILLASELGSASGSSSGPAPNREIIEATAAHPFWVIGKGWTDAGKLLPGDKLLARDGRLLTVVGTRLVKKSVQVYNFTVDHLHTYFVGQQQWLVHNLGCIGFNSQEPSITRIGPPKIQVTAKNRRYVDYILALPDSTFEPDLIKFPNLQSNQRDLWNGSLGRQAAQQSGNTLLEHTPAQEIAERMQARFNAKGISWDDGPAGVWQAVSYRYAKLAKGSVTLHIDARNLQLGHIGPRTGSVADVTELYSIPDHVPTNFNYYYQFP